MYRGKAKGIWAAILSAALGLAGCGQVRDGHELRLKHIVTIATPTGEQTFSSVVSLRSNQAYGYSYGGAGWGAISCRLTGDAVRVVTQDREFYFLLSRPGTTTPAWNQIGLIKSHFGFPNYTKDAEWVDQWRDLAQSGRSVDLRPEDYPAIAVMPRNGWIDEARTVSLQAAGDEGLRVIRYRLQITTDPVGAQPPVVVRYRTPEGKSSWGQIGKDYFSVVNGTA